MDPVCTGYTCTFLFQLGFLYPGLELDKEVVT